MVNKDIGRQCGNNICKSIFLQNKVIKACLWEGG